MENFVIAFITGLTTGGISCLAVQGGLLASSLAHQVEEDVTANGKASGKAQPILLFLGAKLVVYTLLGAMLGLLGSLLQLTALVRAILQFAIGIFMIGNALRMLEIHPIFRYFTFEPPSSVTRFIRRSSKRGASTVTPLFLGALTVLIPCGVTQTMMALAVASGSVIEGAGILFGFTLGASPVFFLLAYLATRLGARLEKSFVQFVAIVLLVLGFVAVDTGLNLAGSPLSASKVIASWRQEQPEIAESRPAASFDPPLQLIEITPDPEQYMSVATPDSLIVYVTNSGYYPSVQQYPGGKDFTLVLETADTYSCALAFVIPALRIETILPYDGTVEIPIPAQPAGSTLYYSCSMGMFTGQIEFTG